MTAPRHAALHTLCLATYFRTPPRMISRVLLVLIMATSVVLVFGLAPVHAQEGSTKIQAVSHPVFLPIVLSTKVAATNRAVKQVFYFDQNSHSTKMIAGTADSVVLMRNKGRLRTELRAAGYQGKALQYFLANEVAGPGPYANAGAPCDTTFKPYVLNHVAFAPGDFCTLIHPNESWFLHNGKGERLYNRHSDGYAYHMNPASSGWRAFALKRMQRDLFGDGTQASLGWDGIFLDNLAQLTYKLRKQLVNSDGVVKEFSTDAAYRAAVAGYLAELSGTLRQGKVLWANVIDDWDVSNADQISYLQHLDGHMSENWALGWMQYPMDATRWDRVLSLAEWSLANGKGVMAVVQGNQDDSTRQQFGLASYLLVATNGPAYFRYANAAHYGEWWQYDNYKVALGAPQGKRYQVGSAWRRDFACGYVEANPTARTGKIVQTCP